MRKTDILNILLKESLMFMSDIIKPERILKYEMVTEIPYDAIRVKLANFIINEYDLVSTIEGVLKLEIEKIAKEIQEEIQESNLDILFLEPPSHTPFLHRNAEFNNIVLRGSVGMDFGSCEQRFAVCCNYLLKQKESQDG